ncbi:MAG TPA: bifunctional UDP-sugar hydrolase/5'-nucleotidase [Candidatus Limnocylindria bacterium]|nr:bifunctional UDP-sugar hydrolase/5'-nucleotidase [Candidatus Limnocylindria bacterium]
MRRGLLAFLLSIAAACSPSVTLPAPSASAALADDRIQLLHTDDIHGHLDADVVQSANASSTFRAGGMAQLAGQVAAYRSRAPQRTLLVDGGDAWQGTFISNANKGQAVTYAMNLMRYDALAVGNHDFDWGQDVLMLRATEAVFPFLGANVIDTRTGKAAPPAYLKPFVVKDLGIAKVGVIGITNPGSATIVKATSVAGLQFLPAAQAVRTYLPEVQKQADIIVVAAHIGTADAVQLAKDVPGIDVIVAAHDHLPIRTARLEGKTTIVDAGAYTQYLGKLEIVVDRATHKMKDAIRGDELTPIAANANVKPDPEIAKLVEERRAEGDKYTSRVVGRTTEPLSNVREETGFGNLITDSFIEYGRQQGWKTDVAFYNMAGVRASFPAGQLTFGQLYEALPFSNTVVSVDLKGSDLRDIIDRAACVSGRLHMAGVVVKFRFDGGTPNCTKSITAGGAPLDPSRVYHITTIDYLLLGGDGHTGFAKGTNVVYGDVEVDVVAAYITAHSPVSPKVEGRLDQS